MLFPMTAERVKTYRTIAKRLSVREVANLFAEFDVPLEDALRILANRR
jgi:hypothetical protein